MKMKDDFSIEFSSGRKIHGNFRAMCITCDPGWEFQGRTGVTDAEFQEVVEFMIKQWKNHRPKKK